VVTTPQIRRTPKVRKSRDKAIARGADPTDRSLEAQVRTAKDVPCDARPWLLNARSQLHRKTSSGSTSMNAFLVIHPFDYVTTECYSHYIIGPYLDPLEDVSDLDTVWILWSPITSPCGRASATSGST
jgi:hypothetical protein